MICSVCNKNTAVVFLNKIENGKKTVEGLCYNCAKEKGINPLEVLAKNANITNEELEDMSNQFESILKDFSENMNLEALGITQEDLENFENFEEANEENQNPIKNIFGIFKTTNQNNNSSSASENESQDSNSGKTVKVQKKEKNKKKKFLDTYGTNLTDKAKNGLLDIVIGREQEIERMIQILNRRSKNNPCLIGEPGVGKTAIVEGLARRIASGDVPDSLLNKRLLSLDLGALAPFICAITVPTMRKHPWSRVPRTRVFVIHLRIFSFVSDTLFGCVREHKPVRQDLHKRKMMLLRHHLS